MPIQITEKSTYMGYAQAFAKEALTEKAYMCKYRLLHLKEAEISFFSIRTILGSQYLLFKKTSISHEHPFFAITI